MKDGSFCVLIIGELFLSQIKNRNLDHYRATARELSKIRKDITFESQQ